LYYYAAVSFSWMSSDRRDSSRDRTSRRAQIEKELAQRAAMYYRLRFSRERALDRLRANVVWDYAVGSAGRPDWLDDGAIETIVDATYARRPS